MNPASSTSRGRSLVAALAIAVVTGAGCSVFQPVGDFFAQGYRNTVSYFNAYYNASRLYDTAVDEIQAARRSQRLAATAGAPQGPAGPPAIPPSARQKLTAVIDKCSNILAFHGKSDYVDDALLLIARSYLLQGEYVKAERKCSELLSQFPQSELVTEARILHGRSLAELSRPDEAEAALTAGLEEARTKEDELLQAAALESLSALRRKRGDGPGALRYASQLRTIAPDNESVASAMLNEAQLLLEQDEPEAALEPLLSVQQATEDPVIVYESEMLRVEALRRLGRLDDALAVVEQLREDFRFKDRLGPIWLERARLLEDLDRLDEAIETYTVADTSYARQASAADAAFELGQLYEVRRSDYAKAQRQYDRSGSLGNFPIAPQARRRAAIFTRYFQIHARLGVLDSLRVAAELVPPDSTGARTNTAVIDSLTTQVTVTMQDLGEWFYSELERPDSAGWWLERSLASGRTHRTTPRGLYLLSDLARTDSTGRWGDAKAPLQRIVADFPESPYAVEARKLLGLPDDGAQRDRPGHLYREAEVAWESGAYASAAQGFDSLTALYPASPLAPKSLYASGWMYDNRLAQPDSAIVRYKAVVQRFGATEYAERARRRLVELTPAAAPVADSLKPRAPSPADVTRSRRAVETQDEKAAVSDSTSKREVID